MKATETYIETRELEVIRAWVLYDYDKERFDRTLDGGWSKQHPDGWRQHDGGASTHCARIRAAVTAKLINRRHTLPFEDERSRKIAMNMSFVELESIASG